MFFSFVGSEVIHFKNLLELIFPTLEERTQGKNNTKYQAAMKIKKSIESATKKNFSKEEKLNNLRI